MHSKREDAETKETRRAGGRTLRGNIISTTLK